MTELEKAIEQIKKQVQSGRLQGQISKEWGQLLYENIHEVLAIPRVRLSLPDSEEITDAAMEYAEIDGTTDEYDESVRDSAHFVAGATWYHKRMKGNGA